MISGQALLNPYLTLVVSSGFEFPSIKLTLRYETVVSTLTRVSFVYDHMSIPRKGPTHPFCLDTPLS